MDRRLCELILVWFQNFKSNIHRGWAQITVHGGSHCSATIINLAYLDICFFGEAIK